MYRFVGLTSPQDSIQMYVSAACFLRLDFLLLRCCYCSLQQHRVVKKCTGKPACSSTELSKSVPVRWAVSSSSSSIVAAGAVRQTPGEGSKKEKVKGETVRRFKGVNACYHVWSARLPYKIKSQLISTSSWYFFIKINTKRSRSLQQVHWVYEKGSFWFFSPRTNWKQLKQEIL